MDGGWHRGRCRERWTREESTGTYAYGKQAAKVPDMDGMRLAIQRAVGQCLKHGVDMWIRASTVQLSNMSSWAVRSALLRELLYSTHVNVREALRLLLNYRTRYSRATLFGKARSTPVS